MKEKNKHTLADALGRLPQFEPPAAVWSGIASGLKPTLADRLPSYQPPAGVWNGLADQLAHEEALPLVQSSDDENPRGGVLRRLPMKWLSIAASLLLVVSISFGITSRDTGPTISYAYSQEVAPSVSQLDLEQDEESFRNVLAQLEKRNEPELNTLHLELAELTEAKEEIVSMLAAYGEDAGVVRQLAQIERDRSDVYRRIIVLL